MLAIFTAGAETDSGSDLLQMLLQQKVTGTPSRSNSQSLQGSVKTPGLKSIKRSQTMELQVRHCKMWAYMLS